MTDNEVRALMLAVAEIRGDVKRILADNERGEEEHDKLSGRITALEEFRWRTSGAYGVVGLLIGSGLGVALTRILG